MAIGRIDSDAKSDFGASSALLRTRMFNLIRSGKDGNGFEHNKLADLARAEKLWSVLIARGAATLDADDQGEDRR
ncbi:MAG: hypothetical protein IH602_04465 [Bryobacteraceae bacterium]|nr:hypothetical protein [Bryobacteraceae bacterium]